MPLWILGTVGAVYLLYTGWRFYRKMDWDEPPESSPDFGAMRRKQAELQHVQDVLLEAHDQGKLSKDLIAEFNRYCDAEIREMDAVKSDWEKQRKIRKEGEPHEHP